MDKATGGMKKQTQYSLMNGTVLLHDPDSHVRLL